MKLRFLIALLFILSSVFVQVKADGDTNDGQSTKKEEVILTKIKTPSSRPEKPTHQEITCVYSDACLVFNFRYPEGMCELTVTEQNGNESSYTFDSASEAVIYVGELTTVHLLITTEYGHSYEGYLL